jgi:membrane fusion protein (multidrug efflux system)
VRRAGRGPAAGAGGTVGTTGEAASGPTGGVWRAAAALGVLLALAGCDRPATATDPAPAGPVALAITTAPVRVRAVERTVSVVGTLVANEEAALASETEGQVIAIEADLGDRVRAGQPLARLRADAPEAALREAEASLAEAQANEARARPLIAERIVSPQEYERVRTALDVARARRDRLQVELDRTVVRAPFDGSVAKRAVGVGDYVRPGVVVFSVVQDDPLKFRGDVPERDVPSVAAGQAVRVAVAPYPDETFAGAVTRVGAASDPQARSLAFEAVVPNGDHRLRPGFFGHGDIVVRHDEGALAVPRSAVTSFAGVTKVFVVAGDVVREREVVVGEDLGDGWVEVARGVDADTSVATSGVDKLSDGAAVTVRADPPPSA